MEVIMSRAFAIFFLLCVSLSTLSQTIYDDQYRSWVEQFHQKEYEKLYDQLDKNIRSSDPHPLVFAAWKTVYNILDKKDGFEIPPLTQLQKDRLEYEQFDLSNNTYQQSLFEEETMDQFDPYARANWIYSRDDILNHEELFELAFSLFEDTNESFRVLWVFHNISETNYPFLKLVRSKLKEGAFDRSAAAKEFLEISLTFDDLDTYDAIEGARKYLEFFPDDPIANRFIAANYKTTERYEWAHRHYLISYRNDPFYYVGNSLLDAAESLGNILKYDDLEALVEQFASAYFPYNTEQAILEQKAKLLLDIGDKGRARQLLEDEIGKYPDSGYINFLFGQLESRSNRHDFAIEYYKKSVLRDPSNVSWQNQLATAYLESNQFDEALNVITEMQEIYPGLSLDIWDTYSDIYTEYEEYELALEVLDQALEYFPSSSWMQRSKAEKLSRLEDYDGALDWLNSSFEIRVPYSWSSSQVTTNLRKKGLDNDQIIKYLRDLTKKYLRNDGLLDDIEDLITSPRDKIAFWEEVSQSTPGWLYPFERIIRIMDDEKIYDEFDQLNQRMIREVSAYGGAKDKIELSFELAIQTVLKLRKYAISTEEYEESLKNFTKYLQDGGRHGAFYQYTAELYESRGLKEKAEEATLQATLYRPDNSGYYTSLITRYGSSQGFKRLYDYLMRDPLNESRASTYCWASVYWSGSPINALAVMQKYNYDFESYRRMAYEQLGFSGESLVWNSRSAVGESQRYINWYLQDRKDFWRAQTEVVMDYETNTARIFFADGTYAEREDDLMTGKIKRLQVGDAFIKADYDLRGNLTGMNSSSGEFVKFTYDSLDHITRMENSQDGIIHFEYNEIGKPVVIEYQGVGTIFVEYDENGEMLGVNSDEGAEVSYKVTSAFSQMLGMANAFKKTSALGQGKLPDLGFDDEDYVLLQRDFDNLTDWGEITEAAVETGIELAKYLISHTQNDPQYGPEACSILTALFDWRKDYLDKNNHQEAIEIIELFHSSLLKIRKRGVALDYWNDWISMQDWLQYQKQIQTKLNKFRLEIERLQDKFDEQPIVLLASTEWLPKAMINNKGYWRNFKKDEILPQELITDTRFQVTYIRPNGDVLVGSNKGLGVLRMGYWEWFAYNPIRKSFSGDISVSRIDDYSNITAIVEDSDGNLWVGTKKGILVLSGDYTDKVEAALNESDGLPSPLVSSMDILESGIVAATNKGVSIIDGLNVMNIVQLQDTEVYSVYSFFTYDDDFNETMAIYAATNQGIFQLTQILQDDGSTKYDVEKVFDEARRYIIPLSDEELLTVRQDEVTKLMEDEASGNLVEIPVYDNILTSEAKNTFGISYLPISSEEFVPAILTDLGISFYKENHFEHYNLPGAPRGAIQNVDYNSYGDGMEIVMINDEAVYLFEESDIKVHNGAVTELISHDSLGVTFIANGSLDYIVHDDPQATLETLEYYSTTNHMALDQRGRLIVNDGLDINRYTFAEDGNYESETLFYADQFEPDDNNGYQGGKVYDILIASNGDIWVTTKMSVFRYSENGSDYDLEEYNFFKDPETFPSNSHWHYAVFEAHDNNVWAIASDEAHLYYNGLKLDGGLLWFNSDAKKFERDHYKNDPYFNPPAFFITSYTDLGDGKAIIGSTAGFGEINDGMVQSYGEGVGKISNASYARLKNEHPNLFLGSEGINVGDIWLFGCAAGIVGYNNGIWFYPDRINQMLPDDLEFGQYGSRHVNALSIDANGRIYVGTDRGLLTYETGGKDAVSFLMSDFNPSDAFIYQNAETLRKEKKTILEGIEKESEAGQLISNIEKAEKDISSLKNFVKVVEYANTMAEPEITISDTDSLNRILEARIQRHAELLLELEQKEPGLYQVLRVPPINLMAQRSQFKEGETVVQYIPLSRKLHIQLVSKEKLIMKEVKIGKQQLMDTVRYFARLMAEKASGRGATSVNEGGGSDEELMAGLTFLFDLLVRPIYRDIADSEVVYVVPNDALYYLPFSALRIEDGRNSRYLVEDLDIGYLSSLYLYQLLFDVEKQNQGTVALFGDPDGSLPGARAEVISLGQLVNSEPFLGNKATTGNFLNSVRGAKYVHLATHGHLDRESLKNSWLLFADKKYTMGQAYSLPLTETDMVVLSACETSFGGEGLEYATLARSFCNAGAATVMATLWQVNDEASKELMVRFYEELESGENKFSALAKAQRHLLSQDGLEHPALWSGYIPIGKP